MGAEMKKIEMVGFDNVGYIQETSMFSDHTKCSHLLFTSSIVMIELHVYETCNYSHETAT